MSSPTKVILSERSFDINDETFDRDNFDLNAIIFLMKCREDIQRDKEKQNLVNILRKAPQTRTKKDILDVVTSVSKNQFLSQFANDPLRITKMAKYMKIQYFQEQQYIITEGEKGDTFYIILSGQVEIRKKKINQFAAEAMTEMVLGDLNSGDSFGELALMNEAPRAASLVAKQPCFLMILTKQMYLMALNTLNEQKYKPIVDFFKCTPVF